MDIFPCPFFITVYHVRLTSVHICPITIATDVLSQIIQGSKLLKLCPPLLKTCSYEPAISKESMTLKT